MVWRLLAAVLLASCILHLELPKDGVVSCGTCPAGLVCAPLVGRCFATRDQDPPVLVSATATDPTDVVVAFSETVIVSGVVSIDGLEVFDVQSAGATLTLLTGKQTPGRNYTIALLGITDAQGNPLTVEQTDFTGYGTADAAAPLLVTPADGEAAPSLTADLSWSTPNGASSFDVEIALDAAFALAASGSPLHVTTPNAHYVASVAARHYWRVRADTTAPDVWSAPRRFEPIGDTVYVYCAAEDAACAAGDDEVGNITSPFRSITRATNAALAQRLAAVRIASRGIPYAETLAITGGGIDISGGWDAQFLQQGAPTDVHSEAQGHRLVDITQQTYITGLALSVGHTTPYATLTVSESTDALTVANCHITSDGVANETSFNNGSIGLVVTGDAGAAPLFDHLSIAGTGTSVPIIGVYVDSGRATLVAPSIDIAGSTAGIGLVLGSTVSWQGGELRVNGSNLAVGILANGGSFNADNISLTLTSATKVLYAMNFQHTPPSGSLTSSRIVINAPKGTGVELNDGPLQIVRDNTLIGPLGATNVQLLALSNTEAQVTNNVLSGSGACAVAVDATATMTFTDNTLAACSPLFLPYGAAAITDLPTLNGASGFSGNTTSAWVAP